MEFGTLIVNSERVGLVSPGLDYSIGAAGDRKFTDDCCERPTDGGS